MASRRSYSTTTYANRTNTTITAPAGIQNGDLLILHFFIGVVGAGPAPNPTWPAGFTEIEGVTGQTSGGFTGGSRLAYKVASGEVGNYVVTHSAAFTQGVLVAVQDGNSSLVPDSTGNFGNGQTSTALGITTLNNNAYIGFFAHNWAGYGTASPPPGTTPAFSEVFDPATEVCYYADGMLTVAGATGNAVQDPNLNSAGQPWAAFLIAVENAIAAPVISNVQVTNITRTTAMITWTTDVAADSSVDYGLSASYGDTVSNASLVTNHSLTLTGLVPGMTYHYRVSSTNSGGMDTEADATFATIGGSGYAAVSSCYGQDANGEFFVICGDYNGRLWKLEQEELSDNNFGYKSVFITPSMTFGNPRVNKKFVRAHIVNGIVNASTITVKVFIDGILRQTTTIDVDPQGMVFGSIVFGSSVFSEGELVSPVSAPIGFIGSRIRFEIFNAVSGEEFFVTQLLVDYKELGPKSGWSE